MPFTYKDLVSSSAEKTKKNVTKTLSLTEKLVTSDNIKKKSSCSDFATKMDTDFLIYQWGGLFFVHQ